MTDESPTPFDPDDPEEAEFLGIPEPGEAYYVEHGWSGCAGSAWVEIPQATRDGWAAAAREWQRAVRAEAMHREAFRIAIENQERIKQIEKYASRCAVMRVEPSTGGLQAALRGQS